MRSYGTITLGDGEFLVQCEPHVALRLKRWFPKLSPYSKILMLSATEENARDLLWFTERWPLLINPETLSRLQALAQRYDARIELVNAILTGAYKPPQYAMALPPRTYQAASASLALTTGGLLVADEIGLGKTVTGLTLLSDPRALPALVVVMPHLQRQWLRELKKFLPALRTHVVKRVQQYALDPMPDVLISSYTKLIGWTKLAGVVKSVVLVVRQMWRGERPGAGTLAHRLIWRHLNGPIPEGLTINHKNGDKHDNRPSNLELATCRDQALHSLYILGNNSHLLHQSGEANHMAKYSDALVAEIRRRRIAGEPLKTIAHDYGVRVQYVSGVARGLRRSIPDA